MRAFGVYADDSWAMTDRITLNAGVRFDLNSGDIPEMPILDAARNEVGTAEAVKDLVDWKTISPRLGQHQAARGRHRHARQLRPLLSGLDDQPVLGAVAGAGGDAALRLEPGDAAYDILQQITDPRGTYVVDPDLKAPYTDQYTIGVDHELIRSPRSARATSTSAPTTLSAVSTSAARSSPRREAIRRPVRR